MKHIKLFESFFGFLSKEPAVPTEIIAWALEHYFGNDEPDLPTPNITQDVHNKSLRYIDNGRNDGYLYRGMGWKNKEEIIRNIKKDGGIQLESPTSWATDVDSADEFADAILIKYPVGKFKKMISMDYVMGSVTDDQLKQLAKIKYKGYDLEHTHGFYKSENEVVVFDKLWIPIENIEIKE